MTVTVIGLGFVGLTTALGLAQMGHRVYGIEQAKERMKLIRALKIPFFEPGLDEALVKYLNNGFFPEEDLSAALKDTELVFFCVGTPYGGDGSADLGMLFSAMGEVLEKTAGDNKFRVLTVKSTVPPGTLRDRVVPWLEREAGARAKNFGVAANPEFLREGHCWEDFINADRIVLGAGDEKSGEILRELYAGAQCPVHVVSQTTAEFIKYLSNSLLATLISYANEMSMAADAFGGVETARAFRILLEDRRWHNGDMRTYAYPGCGYGGYCLPKDTAALHAAAREKGAELKILENVIRVNEEMPKVAAERILKILPDGAALGVLGLSFKPGSDDVRDTPAAKILRELLKRRHCEIFAYDPVAPEEFQKTYPDISITACGSMEEVCEKAGAVCVLTAWPEFKRLPEITKKPVYDGRYML